MTGKPNLLIILPAVPYPLESGGHHALYAGIKAVSGFANLFITFEIERNQNLDTIIRALKSEIEPDTINIIPFVKNTPIPEKVSIYRLLYTKLWYIKERIYKILGKREQESVYTVGYGEFLPKSEERVYFINRIITDYHIEIVQCDMLRCISYVLTLPKGVKTLFVHHEIGFVREQLRAKTLTKQPNKYEDALEHYKQCEVSMLNKFDVVVTLSSIDSKKLVEAGVKIPVVTSFATVLPPMQSNDASRFTKTLTFVGPDFHEPNVLGVTWFLENCWSILNSEGFQLKIIGKWSEKHKKSFSKRYKNVIFSGFVPDLCTAVKDSIMIVPITIGSGIRMKILEAMGIGVPIVSTSVGAEGIPLISGKHCFIVDNPEDFADAIMMLKDDSLRKSFVCNAKELLQSNYSFDSLRKNRTEIINNLVSKGKKIYEQKTGNALHMGAS